MLRRGGKPEFHIYNISLKKFDQMVDKIIDSLILSLCWTEMDQEEVVLKAC